MESDNPYEASGVAAPPPQPWFTATLVAKALIMLACGPLLLYGASLGIEGGILLNEHMEGRADPQNLASDFRKARQKFLGGAIFGLTGLVCAAFIEHWLRSKN